MKENPTSRNFLLCTDSYKQTHWWQYPDDVTKIYSYFEPRINSEYEDIVWMGITPFLCEYGFCGKAFDEYDIVELEKVCDEHFGIDGYANVEGFRYILDKYAGYLPIKIWALPAGTIVKPGTPCMAIENTDDKIPWLTNFVESMIMHAWGMTTTATISYEIYKMIKRFCDITGETVSPFHLNDFGVRGVPHIGTAEMNGIGHLAIFDGTDNLPAIKKIKDVYGNVYGTSVVAAEHSTITSWGRERECDAYAHIITTADKKFNSNGDKFVVVSLVCDSYDWENAVDNYFCGELKDIILNRNGKTVIRPDSGNPPEVTLKILDKLWNAYGGTVNENGFKVLDSHVGVIYGDHIDANMIKNILSTIIAQNYAINNVIFGSGGALLQKHNRDTCNCAIKLSNITLNDNTEIPICKTTKGKESKSGKFDLPIVFENGYMCLTAIESFDTIRERIKNYNK